MAVARFLMVQYLHFENRCLSTAAQYFIVTWEVPHAAFRRVDDSQHNRQRRHAVVPLPNPPSADTRSRGEPKRRTDPNDRHPRSSAPSSQRKVVDGDCKGGRHCCRA
ncbi:hypothetical protein Cfor_01687, partial [Coptotermes formosanus]